MADLTYGDLAALNQRIRRGELTTEQAGSEYSLDELAEGLRMTRGTVQALVEAWSPAQLTWQPPAAQSEPPTPDEDRWSATEAVTHLIATENWYLLHMGRLVGKREHFDVMPHGLGDLAINTVPKEVLATQLRTATDRLLSEITAIPADADMSARRESTYFGELSLRGWVMLAIIHDIDHTEQIRRLTEQSGFPIS